METFLDTNWFLFPIVAVPFAAEVIAAKNWARPNFVGLALTIALFPRLVMAVRGNIDVDDILDTSAVLSISLVTFHAVCLILLRRRFVNRLRREPVLTFGVAKLESDRSDRRFSLLFALIYVLGVAAFLLMGSY